MSSVDSINNLALPDPIQAPVDKPAKSKAGHIAYEVFGMVPVPGTFIGFHHAYKAHKSTDPIDGWEKAKIITQIFSFLLVPQIILGLAHCIKALMDRNNQFSIDVATLPPPQVQNSADADNQPVVQGLTPEGLPYQLDALDENGLPIPLNYNPT